MAMLLYSLILGHSLKGHHLNYRYRVDGLSFVLINVVSTLII